MACCTVLPRLYVPLAAFEEFRQAGKEFRGKPAIGDAVINAERKLRHRPDPDTARSRYHTIALTPDGEYGRLRWIDQCRKSVRPASTEIRDADGSALKFLAPQSVRQRTFDALASAASDLSEAQVLHVMQHRHQQAVFESNHQAYLRAARWNDARLGQLRIARESCVHGRKSEQCASHCLQNK